MTPVGSLSAKRHGTTRLAWICRSVLVGSAPFVGLCSLVAQGPNVWSQATWFGEFSSIPSVRILPGTLFAVDREEHSLVMVTDKGERRIPVSKGQGPAELIGLQRIAPFRGDSSLIIGRDNLRAVVVDGNGKPVRTLMFHRFNSDSSFLFSFHGATSAGVVAYTSPRPKAGERDSADVYVIETDGMKAAKVAAMWFPPPPGVYRDQPATTENMQARREQVVLTASGHLVIYRIESATLEVRSPPDYRRSRSFALPGRDRPKTSSERAQLEVAQSGAKKRADSLLGRLPPEVRTRVAAQMKAGLALASGDRPVPAYADDGLITLSASLVAIRRGSAITGQEEVVDWVDVINGLGGTFRYGHSYKLIGGGAGSLAFARSTEEGFVQLALIPISSIIRPGARR